MTDKKFDKLFSQIRRGYKSACDKHPMFPHSPTALSPTHIRGLLNHVRDCNTPDCGPNCSIRSIQSEEQLEALYEAKLRNWSEAKKETVHLIVTAVRAYEFYDQMIAKDRKAKRKARAKC